MANLSETEGKLIDLMKERGVDKDSCIAVMLSTKEEAAQSKLLEWINSNPNVGQTEIIDYIFP